MNVFDLAKNLPPDTLFVDGDTYDALRDACQPAKEITNLDAIMGLQVHIVENPTERKLAALTISSFTGKSALYVDDGGNLMAVTMPKAAPFDRPIG